MELAFIGIAVAGFTQLVKSLFDRDYRSAVIITGAAIIGGIAGYFNIEVTSVPAGVAVGLFASGLVTLAQATGGQRISKVE